MSLGNIPRDIPTCDNLDEKLNTSGSTGSGTNFYFDYQDGEYGYNTSSVRGADTFHPFKSGIAVPNIIEVGNVNTVNFKTFYPTIWESVTVDNFIVGVVSAPRVTSGQWQRNGDLRAYASGFTVSKTYTSGVFSVSNYSQSVYNEWGGAYGSVATQTFVLCIYIVMPSATVVNLGKVTTYNATTLPYYQNLTVDNFVIELLSAPAAQSAGWDGNQATTASGYTLSKSYDPSTGQFSLSGITQSVSHYNRSTSQTINYNVWIIR